MAHSLESHDPGGKHWRSLSFGREEMEASGAKFEITLFRKEGVRHPEGADLWRRELEGKQRKG